MRFNEKLLNIKFELTKSTYYIIHIDNMISYMLSTMIWKGVIVAILAL